jgi:hypothetical protein
MSHSPSSVIIVTSAFPFPYARLTAIVTIVIITLHPCLSLQCMSARLTIIIVAVIIANFAFAYATLAIVVYFITTPAFPSSRGG